MFYVWDKSWFGIAWDAKEMYVIHMFGERKNSPPTHLVLLVGLIIKMEKKERKKTLAGENQI